MTSSLKTALLADEKFKKECLYTIAKQFDMNQVKTSQFYFLGPSIYTQQAFNVRVIDSGTNDGDLTESNLPTSTFGLDIPQKLSETERSCMKNAINSFMAPRFTVSIVLCLMDNVILNDTCRKV